MFFDLATAFDGRSLRSDLAFDGTDLVIDMTAATPLIVALGCNRRARADDELPDPVADPLAPQRLDARGGWAGDALDAQGRLTGSRWWIGQSRKNTQRTALFFQDAGIEALQYFADLGLVTQVIAGRLAKNIMGVTTNVGPTTLTLALPVLG